MADRPHNIYEQQAANKLNTMLVMVAFILFLAFLGFGFDVLFLGAAFPIATLIALVIGCFAELDTIRKDIGGLFTKLSIAIDKHAS